MLYEMFPPPWHDLWVLHDIAFITLTSCNQTGWCRPTTSLKSETCTALILFLNVYFAFTLICYFYHLLTCHFSSVAHFSARVNLVKADSVHVLGRLHNVLLVNMPSKVIVQVCQVAYLRYKLFWSCFVIYSESVCFSEMYKRANRCTCMY